MIDLPLREEYPFVFLKLKNNILTDLNSNCFATWVLAGKKLFTLELDFTLNVGLYEYLLLKRLRSVNHKIPIHHRIWFDFSLILTVLYMWRFNIGFIIGSILLPIVFYYFFLLIDYYEVIEELLEIINEKLKNS